MPAMVRATVEPPTMAPRRVPRYVRGAAAKVPAWTFGEDWARHHFPGKWRQHMVSGTFVRMLEPEWGLFVWDDPEDAPSELRTLLKHVVWQDDDAEEDACYFDFKDVHVLHNARQAQYQGIEKIIEGLARGLDQLPRDLVRKVDLNVAAVEEFDMIFASAQASRSETKVRNPGAVKTYAGELDVDRRTVSFNFETLKQWAAFVGVEGAVIANHTYKPDHAAGMIPAAMLKQGFTDATEGWTALIDEGLTPLAASRAVSNASTVLESQTARALAENMWDVTVYLLDTLMLGDTKFYYAMVPDGYATFPAADVKTLFGIKLAGHYGYLPANLVHWGKGCKVVTAFMTYTTVRATGVPLRGVPRDGCAIKFRPTLLARASGLVLN